MKFSTKELVQTDGDFIGVFISRGYIPAEFRPLEQTCLPSLNLTWPLKIGFPKRKKVFHPSIFRCLCWFQGRVISWHFMTVHLEASLSFPSKMLDTFKHFNCKNHRWMINDRKIALKPSDQWWFWEMSGSMGWIATVDGSKIRRSPVEVVSLSHYLQVYIFISQVVCRISEPSTGSPPQKFKGSFPHHHGSGKQDPGRWYSSPTCSYYHIPVPWFWEKE